MVALAIFFLFSTFCVAKAGRCAGQPKLTIAMRGVAFSSTAAVSHQEVRTSGLRHFSGATEKRGIMHLSQTYAGVSSSSFNDRLYLGRI